MSDAISLPTVGVAGLYKLQVRRHGLLIYETPWFDNLITNAGLEALGEAKTPGRYAMVGTDNTAPLVGNTTLGAQLASFDSTTGGAPSGGVVTTGTRYGWQRQTYPFPQGAVVGNVAEVGVGWSTTAVFSRALVSPAISVLAIDQLTVVYELRMYVPTVDATGTKTIDSVSYNYTIRPIYADAANTSGGAFGWRPQLLGLAASTRVWCDLNPGSSRYGAMTFDAPCELTTVGDTVLRNGGAPAGQVATFYPSSVSNSAYAAATHECQFTTIWGPDNGNEPDGVQGFIYTGLFGTYQCVLSAAIPKDNTKQLSMTWKQTWARRP